MYYRYKSKTRNKKIYRLVSIVLIAGTLVVLGYQYRTYVLFWRFTTTRIMQRMDQARGVTDSRERERRFRELQAISGDYLKENQLSAEAYRMHGEVRFQLGQSLIRQFTDLIIYEGGDFNVGEKAAAEFIEAVKYLKKAAALAHEPLPPASALIMARAMYYSGYISREAIFARLAKVDVSEGFPTIEDARFYALMHILNGREEHGIEILRKHGKISESIEGQLFLATALSIAKRYTDAIVQFQEVLRKETSVQVQKLVYINLGRIYLNQALHNEALARFNDALALDDKDFKVKIMMARTYSAMGNKAKARAILGEVTAVDAGNEEARKLLGTM
ncbi:MAG: tetratricopeptide repeat protein [Spirochaetes bacterium]|nr:MAG: tetratricopeptide repeat protein [Spirochaetota bacterium]